MKKLEWELRKLIGESKCKAKRRELQNSTRPARLLENGSTNWRFKVKKAKYGIKESPKSVFQIMKCFAGELVHQAYVGPNGLSNKVLFDSGANCCITHIKDDFMNDYTKVSGNRVVDGIGKGLAIKGSGTVAWTFNAATGSTRTLCLPCLYVPSARERIASLQRVLEQYPEETFNMTSTELVLSGSGQNPKMTVPICSDLKLPVADTEQPAVYRRSVKKDEDLPTACQPSLTSPSNLNLSDPEKELLRWHHRLGHIGVRRVQWLFRQGILATSEKFKRLHARAAQLTHGPLCTACQYAKQRRKTMPGTVKTVIKAEAGALKK